MAGTAAGAATGATGAIAGAVGGTYGGGGALLYAGAAAGYWATFVGIA